VRHVRRAPKPVTVPAVASLGVFMAFVDATIVNIAFPDIARSFPSVDISGLSWVLNAYNIAFAAFLVAAGRIADLVGRRRCARRRRRRARSSHSGPSTALVPPVSCRRRAPRAAPDGPVGQDRPLRRRRRIAGGGPSPPGLSETLTRVFLLASSNTSDAARQHADLTITPRNEGVGLLEFHQLDRVREAGRAAAREALEHAGAALFA
jgi:predicted acylesterase/phospholipase RssA